MTSQLEAQKFLSRFFGQYDWLQGRNAREFKGSYPVLLQALTKLLDARDSVIKEQQDTITKLKLRLGE